MKVNVDTVRVGGGPALRRKQVLSCQSTTIVNRKRDYPFNNVRCQKMWILSQVFSKTEGIGYADGYVCGCL